MSKTISKTQNCLGFKWDFDIKRVQVSLFLANVSRIFVTVRMSKSYTETNYFQT